MNKSERPRDWNLEPGNLLYNLPLVKKGCMEVINFSGRGERNEGDDGSRWFKEMAVTNSASGSKQELRSSCPLLLTESPQRSDSPADIPAVGIMKKFDGKKN